jgi:hypothetical protein
MAMVYPWSFLFMVVYRHPDRTARCKWRALSLRVPSHQLKGNALGHIYKRFYLSKAGFTDVTLLGGYVQGYWFKASFIASHHPVRDKDKR